MGYGIFGQKITGIRDIKTPPNGASVSVLSTPYAIASVSFVARPISLNYRIVNRHET